MEIGNGDWQWGRRDLNPHDFLRSTDFKSAASTIPPRPHPETTTPPLILLID